MPTPHRACCRAAQDYDIGGMQLPYTVEPRPTAFFAMASVSINSSMLSTGNANLLMVHGTRVAAAGVCAERVLRPLVRHDVPERAPGRVRA
jgi:hypothetical protein